MSCFILDQKSVQNMLNVALSLKRQFCGRSDFLPNDALIEDGSDFDALGGRLMLLNYRSYNSRYQEDFTDSVKFKTVIVDYSLRDICQALKTAQCLAYNCSDFDGYEDDKDYKTLSGLIDYLRYCVINSLPEYNAARWG